MSPLYTCSKPCSTGTHNETVKNLALSPALDRSNHDRTTAVALFNGQSSERKCEKTTLSRRLIKETLYKSEEGASPYLVSAKKSFDATFSMFLRPNIPEKSSTTCHSNLIQNLVNCIIRIKNLAAFFSAKSSTLIGTQGIAEFGPK